MPSEDPFACPECGEELRVEFHAEGRTGYCPKCAKHYTLCKGQKYMLLCQRALGHHGSHVCRAYASGDVVEWVDG